MAISLTRVSDGAPARAETETEAEQLEVQGYRRDHGARGGARGGSSPIAAGEEPQAQDGQAGLDPEHKSRTTAAPTRPRPKTAARPEVPGSVDGDQ